MHISATFCLLTMTTMALSQSWVICTRCFYCSYACRLWTTQTWCRSARLSLSFHICTLDTIRKGGVTMQQLIVSPPLVLLLVGPRVIAPLSEH